ncbi:hypothetical protein J5Y04_40260 [Kitasatospora sp. RG8]|uniref:hypothetical protein n=1 Tax=Kitasatospora sp. RG8 TaxID=2820815 RepID=UPI001ADF9D59|nr:hypothetical protein [Kitasatospora sp. RG8]MBP0455713.1 hypothetical protein [Kitasatospora sp. RG8]
MNAPAAPGRGRDPTDATRRWQEAAKELAPEKAAPRVAAHAKFVVTTVALVGTALSAVGLVSADRISHQDAAQALAVSAAGVALLAVVMALYTVVPRLGRVNLDDLATVRRWYEKELRRGFWAALAGWLLVLAVVLAGVAGVLAALSSSPSYRLGLQDAGLAAKHTVSVKASVQDVSPGTTVTVEVTARDDSGAQAVIVRGTGMADSSGNATVDASAALEQPFHGYAAALTVGGASKATATLP